MIRLLPLRWRRLTPGKPLRPAAPRSFRMLFVAVTAFLVIAALYTSILIVKRQQTLYEVSRYNSTWLLSQAAVEVARLEVMVATSMVPGSGVGPDQVQLWLEIVENRVRLLNSGEVHDYLKSAPEQEAIAARLPQDDCRRQAAGRHAAPARTCACCC